VKKFKLDKEEEKKVLRIAKMYFTEYNNIVLGIDNIISMYKNYKGNQGFSDYALNYDEVIHIHWFEFMLSVVTQNELVEADGYIKDILINGSHPLIAYDKYKK